MPSIFPHYIQVRQDQVQAGDLIFLWTGKSFFPYLATVGLDPKGSKAILLQGLGERFTCYFMFGDWSRPILKLDEEWRFRLKGLPETKQANAMAAQPGKYCACENGDFLIGVMRRNGGFEDQVAIDLKTFESTAELVGACVEFDWVIEISQAGGKWIEFLTAEAERDEEKGI